jgi:osmotically inducible protein OsmC
MAIRHSDADWTGTLKRGSGSMALGSGAYEGSYSFASRFEDGKGTNPEELIAAAHAGCFTMALSAALSEARFEPGHIHTRAEVHFGFVDGKPTITKIDLHTEAGVPGSDDATFQRLLQETKTGCPVSRALAGTEITVEGKLV